MNSFDAFVDSLAGNELPPARAKDVQKFPCQQCGGTGLWTARRKNYRGNDKCLACQGRGYFLTDENTRRKARAQRTTRKANVTAMARDSFREANPGLYEFLRDAASWSDFAGSLASDIANRGGLTERQLAAACRMREKVEAGPAAKRANTVEVDLAPIREMFDRAFGNGLKRPTYRADGVVLSRAPDNGRNAGALYVKRAGAYCGKVVDGKLYPTREAPTDLAEVLSKIAADPQGEAVRYGRETGTCCCCGRELTDPNSIAAGIGPICAAKWF